MPEEQIPPLFPSTSVPLLAASFWIHSYCKKSYDTYMRCKKDPTSSCLAEAEDVLSCSKDFFNKIAPCASVFKDFFKCLDMNNQDFKYCRTEEDLWDLCAIDRANIEGKKLWKGESPHKDGYKSSKAGPELISKSYIKHCQKTKVK